MITKIYEDSTTTALENAATPAFVKRALAQAAHRREELSQPHLSYEEETKMLLCIKNGAPEELAQIISGFAAGTPAVGTLSDNALSQSRCLFVAAITLFTRFAIEGGLPQTQAYDLSDAYIKYIHTLTNPAQIAQLSLLCGMDFARRVKQAQAKHSATVKKCCEYIEAHLYEKITVAEVARFGKRNAQYLSAQFKQQLGLSPKEYILHAKLKAGRALLLTGDASVSQVAQRLGFVTHSNFALHFKRRYGLTPSQCRQAGCGPGWESLAFPPR